VTGPIPEWLLSLVATATVFTIMFGVGIGVTLTDLRWIWQRPFPMLRALCSVLIVVPLIALAVCRSLGLPRFAEIGVVLMSISPGAPIALRRSLGAGGHRAFAPSLQICVALLAVGSLPLSLWLLDFYYRGNASVSSWHIAKQVFVVQLLPIGLGVALRRFRGELAARLDSHVGRLGTMLLLVLALLALLDVWQLTVDAGPRVATAIVLVTLLALAAGHALGGPEPAQRTAVAISSAARNAGLALLVATVNKAPPQIEATVLAYLAISVFALVPYVVWRRRVGARAVRGA
jgi:bile acid:Na+ symporter, BASS family